MVRALDVISGGLIALACFSLDITLVAFVRKCGDLRLRSMVLSSAVFIFVCGITHLFESWTIWHPIYGLFGEIKTITAWTSAAAASLLAVLLPLALRESLPALKHEIRERIRAEESLRRANALLEVGVEERTAQLEEINRTLTTENERFEIAADAAGLGFWSLDIATRALRWDDRMFELYGRSPLAGVQDYGLWANSLHPEDLERCKREAAEACNGGSPFDTEFRIFRPDRTIRHIRAVARVTRDVEGRAVRAFGVNFDVTELKRAEELFHLAIEAAPTGMLLMSQVGIIVLVNTQIEHLFGYRREELLGQRIEMLVPERLRAEHPVFPMQLLGAPKARSMGAGADLYGLRKDGSEVPIEVALNPVHTSDGNFVLSSIIDRSQRLELDRVRTDFVSTVSHELRTPLTSINGSLGLLNAGAMGVLPDKAATMIRIAYRNSGRLVRLINDILDLGRLEAGKLTLKITSVSLLELIQQAIEENVGYAERFRVRFVVENLTPRDHVMADPDRLMQVVTNLLSNAAKFSRPGTDVRILVRPGLSAMRVEVVDSGYGIPVAFQHRIFEKFVQVEASQSRRFEGTGLGLSISRRLVEAMGGSIGFATVVDHGTTFFIELPWTTAAASV
jgi:PAS domain S-box-containing protein